MIEFLLFYKYIAFFVGMIIGGDLVLIIGIYLSIQGQMDIRYVISLAVAATLISDLIWYCVGKYIPKSKMSQWKLFTKRNVFFSKVSTFFNKHSLKTVFYSKFIYGTRTIVQLMVGAHGINIPKYIGIDILGTLLYIFLIVGLGYTLKLGLSDLQGIVHNTQITFAIFVLVIFAINYFLQKRAEKLLK